MATIDQQWCWFLAVVPDSNPDARFDFKGMLAGYRMLDFFGRVS